MASDGQPTMIFSNASELHPIRFGTDGWRALIAKEFTYENLELFLDGFAIYVTRNYIPEKPVVIGFDARFLADKFAKFSAEILNKWGINVKFINNYVPTPVIAHAALAQNSCGALMFTASHNPPEYMGLKYIPEYAGPSSVEIINKILVEVNNRAELLSSGIRDLDYYKYSFNQKAWTENLDPFPDYKKHIYNLINFDALRKLNSSQALTVVYDSLYGCGRGFSDVLLREAGFNVISIHDRRDPTFGGSMPDPSETRLNELKTEVLKQKAVFGAANDGDADRFAYISGNGEFFPANKALPIILKYLAEIKGLKGTVARTLASTHLLDDLADKFGFKHVETTVGFKWLCEVMRSEPTIIACEESGGMSILGHIPEKDGLLAILLLAEVIAVRGLGLEELWAEVQDFAGKKYFYDRLDLHFAGASKEAFVKFFTNTELHKIGDFKITKADYREGAKLYLDNGSWLLARASGTEAMCRVYFEGNDQNALIKLVSEVENIVSEMG